jgi:non-ribosomal peptide synthetase component F
MINAVASLESHETPVDTFYLFLSVFEEEVLTILSHGLKPAEQHLDTNMIQNTMSGTKLNRLLRVCKL